MALAFSFMTRVPILIGFEIREKDIANMVLFFPLTSIFVGAFMFGVFYLTGLLGFEVLPFVAAIIAGVIITGALHLDGFIDCADAFFVSKSKERALEILKDSRVGAYGVIACVLLLLTKYVLLTELGVYGLSLFNILIAMPVAGKIPLLVCAYLSKHPREEGSGKSVITLSKFWITLISVLASAAILWHLFGIQGAIMTAVLIVLGFIYVFVGKWKIGGATGDLLGSANETGEIVFLISLFMLMKIGV